MDWEKIILDFLQYFTGLSRLFPGGSVEAFLLSRRQKGKPLSFFLHILLFPYHLYLALTFRRSGLFSKGVFRYTAAGYRKMRKDPAFFLIRRRLPILAPLIKLLLSEAYYYAVNGNPPIPDSLPSLVFSPEKYLEKYDDVREKGLHALYHYIKTGYREKRDPFALLPVPLEKEAYEEKCREMLRKLHLVYLFQGEALEEPAKVREAATSLTPPESPGKIAVHLHLYYPEMLPLFLMFLRNIPFPFDLFLSLRKGEGEQIRKESLEKVLPRLNELFLEEVPNRGRDAAPLICTFGERLYSGYDIFCHIHTKKSPHDPGLEKWAGKLLEALLGSEEKIREILALLQKDGKIVFPAMGKGLEPDPLTFWNAAAIPSGAFLEKNGINIKDHPIIDFPHGNMFWARTGYLKPFLELGLTCESFPEEPIGEEGSLAHILEHSQLILARGVPGKAYCLRDRSSFSVHTPPCL